MAKVTTKEMIALIDEDLKFALEIGDKEFVRYLKGAKAKLLDEVYPTRNEEYDELFCCLADEDTVEIDGQTYQTQFK